MPEAGKRHARLRIVRLGGKIETVYQSSGKQIRAEVGLCGGWTVRRDRMQEACHDFRRLPVERNFPGGSLRKCLETG